MYNTIYKDLFKADKKTILSWELDTNYPDDSIDEASGVTKNRIVKYWSYLILSGLFIFQAQGQPAHSSSESNAKSNLMKNEIQDIDSILTRQFALCYSRASKQTPPRVIIYFEAAIQDNQFHLSTLKGNYSDIVYEKLLNTLACMNENQDFKQEMKFILLHREVKQQEEDEKILQDFRKKYAIEEQVQVIKTIFGPTIKCGGLN